MTAWEKVEIARNPKRKTSLDYIDEIFDEFMELHGDRNFKDDKAIVCGLARIEERGQRRSYCKFYARNGKTKSSNYFNCNRRRF